MLNVAHVKNDVKWRPILWELVILVWEFYMLKSNIDVFFMTSFLCSLQFLLFYRIEYPKRCLWTKIEFFSIAQFLWYDCTFKKQCTVPVTLTFDLWRSICFQWIEYNPISILYKFQIDFSSNSWEIKYQNIGRTHTQTHTHTDRQTDRPGENNTSQPLRGRGN